MALEEILKHIDAAESLCAELPPHVSPRSRRTASRIFEQLASIEAVVSHTFASPSPSGSRRASQDWYYRFHGSDKQHGEDGGGADGGGSDGGSADGGGSGGSGADRGNSDRRGGVDGGGSDGEDDNPREQDGADKDNPAGDDDEADVPKPNDKEHIVALRADKILQVLGGSQRSLDDVAGTLFGNGPKRKVADLEDLALSRLLRGIPQASVHDWTEHFGDVAANIDSVTSMVIDSAVYDGVESISERLKMRHKGLTSTESGNIAGNAMIMVLRQIETIKFAVDWQARGALPGGKKWISDFYKATFMQDPSFATEFQGLTEGAIKQKLQQLEPVFAKWRSSAGHTVTARNRLLKMYNTFGPAVLLDPTWQVNTLVRRRSRLFVPVMEEVSSRLQEEDPGSLPSHSRACRALVHIMTVLGGKDVGRHVRQFVKDVPPMLA
ncbi:hypothetical protein EVJ58_g8282 [Rhodofomes roseus]|uniref:Uncharacterized protein n=1 Tax=Rhodofomes roseus TaxID=34475 RepID=A0A4Y9Y1Y2_9APHY|nr:hypothetical protein EVJ58_g8282 [Rhodofomes roseus]